jgi:small subunit ribosomal protein S13
MAEEKKYVAKEAGQLVRIKETDIPGHLTIMIALTKVRGVGYNLSRAICILKKVPEDRKVGELTDPEIADLEEAIDDPGKLGVPVWMFNRRKDYDTGSDMHVSTTDLHLEFRQDIDRLGEIKSYKGLRHPKGLKLRGQRTASTGRGKSAVSVQRKKK